MQKKRQPKLRECWIENHICYVPMASGEVAMCDEDRFEEVNNHNWWVSKKRNRYPKAFIEKKRTKMHSFLYPEIKLIDHINRNTLDNRSCNLRETTPQGNSTNRKTSSKKFKGVSAKPYYKKYHAKIKHNQKDFFIGSFNTPEEAARAYDKKARELFGEFAYLNFPNEVNL